MDLRGVFNSEPKSLFDTVSEAGQCFYLPAYQRPYSWSKTNINRVFEDVLHGIENSVRNEDAITFIGTLLTIHDTKFETIVPHKKGEVPSKVMLIIDGQQRLTTLLLIMTALHDFLKFKEQALNKLYKKNQDLIEKDPENMCLVDKQDDLDWLLDKINQEIANLRYFTTDTNSNRDKLYRFYPKLIRAYQDCWSKVENGALYESPIARYLHLYNSHILEHEESDKYIRFNYDIENEHKDFDKHKLLISNLAIIKKHINKISKISLDDADYPNLIELMKGEFKDSFQFDIPEAYLNVGEQCAEKCILESLNVIVFSKYLLNRVCVTYVTVTDEAYAFDMFEALNTTGEPLTSIETFKPKVIENEGLGNYEASESKRYFDLIDKYLDSISDATKKHKETNKIMLSFALAETGDKISKHISDQRRYLLNSYRDEEDKVKKGFVKNLSLVTKFYYEEWDRSLPKELTDNSSETNELLLCIDVLRKSGHEITVPLLSRYYSSYIDSDRKDEDKAEFTRAIKVVVAFFVLWRAAHKNTAGIDAVYRDLLRHGDKDLGIEPFSRSSTEKLIVKPLSLYLRNKLINKLTATDENIKEKWILSAFKNPVYDISLPLTRLMMLAAFNDTCPIDNDTGMIEKSTKGHNTMLSWHKWKVFFEDEPSNKYTIEHIAPQTLTDCWDQSLYENQELIGSLGNLTILPSSANSSASNKSWDDKKKYYSVLCKDSLRQKEKLLEGMGDNQQQILLNSQYLGYLQPISNVGDWNAEFISKRSKNLLSYVWDVFSDWLDVN
ncbi:hypothetical protein MNBD_GAMMA11-3455 [hydrothermal vent metagenome]|uniref:DUF262 domain-containing protein n=1 Tax=hydrothermal vent metagenome TaxID=652676 RepID=A0A3B0XP45_9ZZZZ